jgi:double-strand break repair protein MRE11
MKILITTDNHLGYRERVPEVASDSYNTFNEVLSIACRENVDLVLQGGDLFHDNRPSRNCLNRTIALLRHHCLGTKKHGLRSNTRLNTQDSDLNVSIPVIAIHGNHDDPSGMSMVSPMHILQSSGLVNYVGRAEGLSRIDVHPILIEKDYRVAIYALGHIKDRRLYKLFSEESVVFHRRPDHKSWYNILVVHQNRVRREKEYLAESFIDDFFDLVIYGHEHESMVVKSGFLVLQPGSTIRTSLCEAEGHDKYVYILDVNEQPVLRHIRLQTVRPFIMDRMRIEEGRDAEDSLIRKIEEMLARISEPEVADASISRTCAIEGRVLERIVSGDRDPAGEEHKMPEPSDTASRERLLPLVRLRVEISGATQINRHRLGLHFRGRVANPSEMLLISRRTAREELKLHPQEEKIEIAHILRSILRKMEFSTITDDLFTSSLHEFVTKGNKLAFSEMVKKNIGLIVRRIDHSELATGGVERAIKKAITQEYLSHVEASESGAATPEDEVGAKRTKVQDECDEDGLNLAKYLS